MMVTWGVAQALGHEEETTAHVPEEGQQAPSISENVSAGQGVERDLHPGEDCASPLPEPHGTITPRCLAHIWSDSLPARKKVW